MLSAERQSVTAAASEAPKKRVSSSGTLLCTTLLLERGDNQKANIELVHPKAQ
jgi:hypothetical protein